MAEQNFDVQIPGNSVPLSSSPTPDGPPPQGLEFSAGRHILALMLLVFIGTLAYLPSFWVPFVYDDLWEISGNRALDNLSDLKTILQYNPARALLMLTFAVDRHFWGLNPLPYHVENLIIHLMTAFLVYWIGERLLGRLSAHTPDIPTGKRGLEVPKGYGPGLFIGAIFVTHPLFVEAVTYVASRSSSLATLFFLAAFACWIKFREAQAAGVPFNRRLGWMFFTLNLYIFSILTKEEGVSLPAILLAYDLWLAPRPPELLRASLYVGSASPRNGLARWYAAVLPFFGVLLALLLIRLALFGTLNPPVIVRSRAENIATALEVIWVYLKLLVAPVGLSLYHDYPIVTDASRIQTWAALMGHFGLIATACFTRKRFPLMAFSVLWLYATLSPTTSIIPLKEVMAEHRMYLAAVGPLVLLGAGGVWFRTRTGRSPLWIGIPVSLILMGMTFRTNRLWQDDVALWQRALDLNPHSGDAAYALGDALRRRKAPNEALKAYQQAINNYEAKNTDLGVYKYSYVDSLHNLGIVYGQKGNLDMAIAQFRRALNVRPRFAPAWTSLGYTQSLKGLHLEASFSLEEAVRLEPDNWLAHYHLGMLYAGPELDPEKASLNLKRCLELEPSLPINEQIKSKLIELGY